MNKVEPKLMKQIKQSVKKEAATKESKTYERPKVDKDYLPAMYMLLF
jgi:hypothetical protein